MDVDYEWEGWIRKDCEGVEGRWLKAASKKRW
jgi:hypothetical protein